MNHSAVSYIRSYPCLCGSITLPARQLLFLFRAVEICLRCLSINAPRFVLTCLPVVVCLLVDLSAGVFIGPLTSALDPAFLLTESSVPLPLSLARFRIKLAPDSWTGFHSSSHVYLVCCSNYSRVAVDTGVADGRPVTVVLSVSHYQHFCLPPCDCLIR